MKKLWKPILILTISLFVIVTSLLILRGMTTNDFKPSASEALKTPGAIVTISPRPEQNSYYPNVNFFMVKKDETLEPLTCSHWNQKDRTCKTSEGEVLLEFEHHVFKAITSMRNVYKTTLGEREAMTCWKPDGIAYVCMPRDYVFNYEEDKKLANKNAK